MRTSRQSNAIKPGRSFGKMPIGRLNRPFLDTRLSVPRHPTVRSSTLDCPFLDTPTVPSSTHSDARSID
jgi:hypothetical protein